MVWQSEVGIYSGSTSLPFRLWILCVHKPKQMKGEEKKKKNLFCNARKHYKLSAWEGKYAHPHDSRDFLWRLPGFLNCEVIEHPRLEKTLKDHQVQLFMGDGSVGEFIYIVQWSFENLQRSGFYNNLSHPNFFVNIYIYFINIYIYTHLYTHMYIFLRPSCLTTIKWHID